MTEAVLEAGSWLYKMFFTLVLAVIAVAMIGMVVRNSINTIPVQHDVMLSRILYDPHGFWYIDPQGMSHPGVLDFAKFTQTHADEEFIYKDNYGGARLTLQDATGTTQILINEKTFTRIATNTEAKLRGGGSISVRTYPVTVTQNEQRRTGILTIELAMPERTT